ncbi:MAG: response regulator transcription factor [Lachnospiraceae bacterium]|jgi:DNA-binding response OmpR family regulator|nr:response regulator transcription factor [Lachnospiraceae bacterium]
MRITNSTKNPKSFMTEISVSEIMVLIIDPDPSLINLYAAACEKNGFNIEYASDADSALSLIDSGHVSLIVLNTVLPGIDGYELLKTIREHNRTIPIILTSPDNDFLSKSRGFLLEADDFMVKPVQVGELMLRIWTLLRRVNRYLNRQIRLPHLVLDLDSYTVTMEDQVKTLPLKEFQLLYILLEKHDKVYTREQLMNQVWGQESNSNPQTVDVHIARLRKQFRNCSDFKIVTIRGLGYKAVLTD